MNTQFAIRLKKRGKPDTIIPIDDKQLVKFLKTVMKPLSPTDEDDAVIEACKELFLSLHGLITTEEQSAIDDIREYSTKNIEFSKVRSVTKWELIK